MSQMLMHLIQLQKKYSTALNIQVDKLKFNKFGNIQTCVNNLKTKKYDLDVCKSKTVSVRFIKLSDVLSKEVAKKTKSTH